MTAHCVSPLADLSRRVEHTGSILSEMAPSSASVRSIDKRLNPYPRFPGRQARTIDQRPRLGTSAVERDNARSNRTEAPWRSFFWS